MPFDWRLRAQCADYDSAMFDALDEPGGYPPSAPATAEDACNHCPVWRDCAALADATQSIGLFGGSSRYFDGNEYVTVAHLDGDRVSREPAFKPVALYGGSGREFTAGELAALLGYSSRNGMRMMLGRWGVAPSDSVPTPSGPENVYQLSAVVNAREARKAAA